MGFGTLGFTDYWILFFKGFGLVFQGSDQFFRMSDFQDLVFLGLDLDFLDTGCSWFSKDSDQLFIQVFRIFFVSLSDVKLHPDGISVKEFGLFLPEFGR